MSWAARQAELAQLTRLQLFFIGGAPRSGTTWLQQLLDSHHDISCRGEGLFLNHLLVPLEKLMAERGKVLEGKNTALFRHTGGYPLPLPDDTEFLGGTAILLALLRQTEGRACHAVGEKTPENVFFFPRLRHLFPAAKFIVIARDPRDVLTSAWHFFRKPVPAEHDSIAKTEFIRLALPSLAEGARATVAFAQQHPSDTYVLTYERLRENTVQVAGELFRFLGVADAADLVAACVQQTAFTALTGCRRPGEVRNGAFLRTGISGDWRSTLTEEMNQMVLRELGWTFPHFGWRP